MTYFARITVTTSAMLLTRSSRRSSPGTWGMKLKKNRGQEKSFVAVARKIQPVSVQGKLTGDWTHKITG